MSLSDRLRDDAQELAHDLTEVRHRLHEHPEIGLDLPVTQRIVLEQLEGLDLEISTGSALSSVTAVLRGSTGGPTVLLRGDMDALPVTEATGVEFASKVQGAMHACGHDLHTAMLLGAARLLRAHRDELAGDVVFMFQPGEEGWDGAGRHDRRGGAGRLRPARRLRLRHPRVVRHGAARPVHHPAGDLDGGQRPAQRRGAR